MYAASLAWEKNFLCFSKSSVLSILIAGFFYKHADMKSRYSWLQNVSCLLSVGGSLLRMTRRTRIAGSSEFGASPFASSIAVIPSDHMSALKSYPSLCSITSGAIQHGEPTKVYLFYPALMCAETPKSLKKICPFESIRMLPALMSLCI